MYLTNESTVLHLLKIPRLKYEDNIKMAITVIVCEGIRVTAVRSVYPELFG